MADPLRVGPVVGAVDESKARVVVQPKEAGRVRVTLTPEGGGAPVVRERAGARREVLAFELDGLSPGTGYDLTVAVDGTEAEERRGRVVTRDADVDHVRLAAVSCNFTTLQGRARLWERLWNKWVQPGTLPTVLHVGDQIYADDTFGKALEEVHRRGRRADVRRKWESAFEELYAYTWNYPATRKVLAHASNLMIWDDHEVRNSWGGFEEDRDPDSDESFVGSMARTAYQRFQRALWGDPDPDAAHEAHAHAWGRVGVLFLDQRTGRSFRYDPERPHLGPAQWSWLRRELREGALATVRALVLVTSVPLCYVSRATASVGGLLVSDLRDHWTHEEHMTEQVELLSEIRRWLRQDPGRRLLVLGGDVHVGGKTRVEHRVGEDWQALCEQIITSPITNEPPGTLAFRGLRDLLLRGWHEVGDTYRFDHDEASFTHRRNFAVVTLRAPARGPATIHASLEIDADD